MFRCTLVTPLKNERDNIERLWGAIHDQTRVPDEWIITDNGSTDGTYEWMVEHSPASPFAITVLRLPEITIARMLNIAIHEAKWDVIVCCHGGTRIPKKWLRNLLRPMEQDTTVQVVAGVWDAYGETRFEQWVADSIQSNLAVIDEKRWLPASRSLAFSKTAWNQVGGFPEWLPRFGEDTLFDIRLRAAGYKFAIAKDAVVGWRPKSSFRAIFRQHRLYSEADAFMGLSRFSVRRFCRPWLILVAAVLLGGVSGSVSFGIVALLAGIGADYVRLNRLRVVSSFSSYFLWGWFVPIAEQTGVIRATAMSLAGVVRAPESDRRAVEHYRAL
jgi:cellulose synthase/poly-beta-1,6-N-acetylglucosamine synthase-like glycosyltransferase